MRQSRLMSLVEAVTNVASAMGSPRSRSCWYSRCSGSRYARADPRDRRGFTSSRWRELPAAAAVRGDATLTNDDGYV